MDDPKSPSHLYKKLTLELQQAGVERSETLVRFVLKQRARLEWSDLIASKTSNISEDNLAAILEDIEKLKAGMPLSRLYKVQEFWGMEFSLGDETLDPRPDTEVLVQKALDVFKGKAPDMFLELGTGTGCITAALLSVWSGARAVATDLSFGALQMARKNLENNGLKDRAALLCADWLEPLNAQFDLVVSNPPYITESEMKDLAPGVVNHDPILALSGGKDGLDAYRKIFFQLNTVLKPGGTGLFEIGYSQAEDVVRLAEESGFLPKSVQDDLAGRPRVVEISRGDK